MWPWDVICSVPENVQYLQTSHYEYDYQSMTNTFILFCNTIVI